MSRRLEKLFNPANQILVGVKPEPVPSLFMVPKVTCKFDAKPVSKTIFVFKLELIFVLN